MAQIATFQDRFQSASQSALWTGNFGTLGFAIGSFTITNPASYTGYGGMVTNQAYNMTNDCVYCKVGNLGSQSLASCESVPLGLIDSGNTNKLFWYANSGSIYAFKTVAGTQTQITSATYNSSTMKWFCISEGTARKSGTGVAGTTYFEYSADGKTWTLFTSLTDPITMTALIVNPSLGTYASEASPTTMVIDSYNVPNPNPGAMLIGA